SPSGRELTIRPKVLVVTPEEELRWLGHFFVRGLFDGEHFFRLTEVAEGRTRFVHGENFSGILLKPMTGRITDTARGFVLMNQALKRRVESLQRAPTAASRV
ncbi:MAG TPA: SRPBCC domain-containing protein, partial [Polyangiaceae bacterium]